jgi:hypothetical protein
MHPDRVWMAWLGFSVLAACETSQPRSPARVAEADPSQTTPAEPAQIAGGQTSEFSGGNVPYGYCPHVASRTSLDLARADVAALVALAAGQHEVPLRWRREFPDERIRGFEERTSLLLDVQVLAAEDVLCESVPGDTGYETAGYRQLLRRLELAVEFSTADGAVKGSFQQPFVASTSATGQRDLFGGERFPIDELEGALELGVDPGLQTESQTLTLWLTFNEQGASGEFMSVVMLPGPYRIDGSRPSWVPVRGTFPAPGEGCEAGPAIALDEPNDLVGDTPRAAYELARAPFPAQPLRAAWYDPRHEAGALTWTELTLRPGLATHACLNGRDVEVYAPLRLESADGLLVMEATVASRVYLQPALAGQARALHDFSMSGWDPWTPRAEFEAIAGMPDLDLGLAVYGSRTLFQAFDLDAQRLQGALGVRKWENYEEISLERPVLNWCEGDGCEAYWCLFAAIADGAACE